jgi:hypothetical protein
MSQAKLLLLTGTCDAGLREIDSRAQRIGRLDRDEERRVEINDHEPGKTWA